MSVLTFDTRDDACRSPRPGAPRGTLLRLARLMLARSRERRALAEFDATMLRDIGVTPYEAGVEARKPFWRA